eukprot:9073947-Alexandrium_andersonii.AAC.1
MSTTSWWSEGWRTLRGKAVCRRRPRQPSSTSSWAKAQCFAARRCNLASALGEQRCAFGSARGHH